LVLDDRSFKPIKLFAVIMKSRVDWHLHLQVMMDEINSGVWVFFYYFHVNIVHIWHFTFPCYCDGNMAGTQSAVLLVPHGNSGIRPIQWRKAALMYEPRTFEFPTGI